MTGMLALLTVLLIGVHIWACTKENKAVRAWTKPFLVPMMGLTFFTAVQKIGIPFSFWPAVFLALLSYTLGDILLIGHKKNLFIGGVVAFTIGHVAFSWIFSRGGMSIAAFLVASAFWFTAFYFLINPFIDWKKKDQKLLGFYSMIVVIFAIFAGGSRFGGDVWAHFSAVLGSALFALSDSILFFEIRKKTDMSAIIMLTYISAVALLLLSVFLLLV